MAGFFAGIFAAVALRALPLLAAVCDVVALRAGAVPADLPAADLPTDLAGAARPTLLRLDVALLEAVRPGADLVDAPFDALLETLLEALVDAVFDTVFAAVFPGAPRLALVRVVADLPPVPAVDDLPAVLLVEAFLVAGLLAPVLLLADLRGLVVAMHVSRRMVASPRRPIFDNTRGMQAR